MKAYWNGSITQITVFVYTVNGGYHYADNQAIIIQIAGLSLCG